MTYYTTMTAKGQITVPAAIRKKLNLLAGKKYAVDLRGDKVIIEKSDVPDIEELRAKVEAIMRKNGTWGKPIDKDEAWRIHIEEKYGKF